MTGRIFDIKRFAVHDGDGIRTTVFFKGCPLKCVWCHNPEGIGFSSQLSYLETKCIGCGSCVAVCPQGSHRMENGNHTFDRAKCVACGKCEEACPAEALKLYGKEVTVDSLLPLLLEDRIFYESSGGGVTLSGGECLMQADFCAELLQALKNEGIHTAVDTCGFVNRDAIDKVMPFTDIFLYDLKSFDADVHKRCTGCDNRIILENLRYIDACGRKTEIRIPYVPRYNADQVGKIAEFLAGLEHVTKVRVLAYHNYAGSKYDSLTMENTLPQVELPTQEEIRLAEELVEKARVAAIK